MDNKGSNFLKPYYTKKAHNFFDVARIINKREVRQGDTVTFLSEVDLTEIDSIRENIAQSNKPSYTAFVVKAATIALKEFPYANRRLYHWPWLPFYGSRLQCFENIDIAVACERHEPNLEVVAFIDVIREVDRLNISEITKWLTNLANANEKNNTQWRSYKTLVTKTPSWLSSLIIGLPVFSPKLWWKWRGGALMISSPGKYGVDTMIGAWAAPLGISFGFAKDRPIVKNKEIFICKTFNLTLNFDRRVMAGAQAAMFFKKLVEILENPKKEMPDFLN